MNSWQVILYNTHPLLRDRPSGAKLFVGGCTFSDSGASDYINSGCLEQKLRRRHHRGRRRLRLANDGRTTLPLNQLSVAFPNSQRSFWQRYSKLRASKSHIRSRISRVTVVPTSQQTPVTVLPSLKSVKEAATAVSTRTPYYYTAAV